MAALKAYTLGVNGFVHPKVIDALGEPSHIRQAHVFVVAPSKAAAARLCDSLRPWIPHVSLSDPEFRVCPWAPKSLESLIAAVGAQPGVLVMSLDFSPEDAVLLIEQGGPRRVGRLRQDGYIRVFVPDENEEYHHG